MSTRPLPTLLTAAAHVLDQVEDLPAATVTCNPADLLLPAVALTPACLDLAPEDQAALVHAVADYMGWPLQSLSGTQGWSTTGCVDGIEIQVLAAPLGGGSDTALASPREVTTIDHARLLHDLVEWSATLPKSVTSLEVGEDLDDTGRLIAHLVVAENADVEDIPGLVLDVSEEGWSSYHGSGVLPTGHALTVSVGL